LSLARAYQHQEKWAAAREQLAQALKWKPNLDRRLLADLQAADLIERGRALYGNKKYEEALQVADAALKLFPDHPEGQCLRISALVGLERYPEARHACDAYLAQDRSAAEVYEIRGLARASQQDFRGAIEDYTRALILRPGTASLHTDRGWAYVYSGAPKLALADFEEAIQADFEEAIQ